MSEETWIAFVYIEAVGLQIMTHAHLCSTPNESTIRLKQPMRHPSTFSGNECTLLKIWNSEVKMEANQRD